MPKRDDTVYGSRLALRLAGTTEWIASHRVSPSASPMTGSCGVSSTPWCFASITEPSRDYWIARSSRAMTAVRVAIAPHRHCEPTGRRRAPPDDRLREAIQGNRQGLDCFRLRQKATAERSSQALLAMTRKSRAPNPHRHSGARAARTGICRDEQLEIPGPRKDARPGMTTDMTSHSRDTMRPSCPSTVRAISRRGRGRDPQARARGMPGARGTRGPCAKSSAHGSHHRYPGNTRHSLRDGFTAYTALSRATNSSCPPRRRIEGDARTRLGSHHLRPA